MTSPARGRRDKMPPPRTNASNRSTPVFMLVVVLAIASLVPQQSCINRYHQELVEDESRRLNDAPPSYYEKLKQVAERIPLYLGPLSVPNITIKNVDIGLQAQIENGFPLEPVSNVLPKKLFMVYGLESSGTTFTAKTIAEALGIPAQEYMTDRIATKDSQTQVHHISLPLGWIEFGFHGYWTQFFEPLPTVPVLYPIQCEVKPISNETPPAFMSTPEDCRDFMGDEVMSSPHRYFVNMTSNIQWYRERGVRVYPVMVIRDPMLHFQGITNLLHGHTPEEEAAFQQYEQGRAIMIETIEKGLNPLIVSYESMLTLQGSYLKEIFRKLGIEFNLDNARIRNGNTKHVFESDAPQYVEVQLMKEDSSAPEGAVFPANQQEWEKRNLSADVEDTGTTNDDHPAPRLVFDPVQRVFKVDYGEVHHQSLPKEDDDTSHTPSSSNRSQTK